MQNNKAYLEKLGIVFLVTFFIAVTDSFIVERFIVRGDNRAEFWDIVIIALSLLTTVFNTGLTTKKWNAAAAMLVSFILIQALEYFLAKKWENANSIFWMHIIGYFIPYFIFVIFLKPKREKIPVIFLCLLLLFGTAGLYQAGEGFERLALLFKKDWNIPGYVSRFLAFFISQLTVVILLNELVNYNEGKNRGYSPRLINPGNEYNKISGTIVFWVFKTFIYCSLFGCFSLLRLFLEHLGDSGYSSSVSSIKWYLLFDVAGTTGLLLVVSWYLRKFLLEFFISYNQSSRFLYWFLLLPVLGFFAWLVILADSKKQVSSSERKATIEKFSGSSRNGVIAILVTGLVLRLLMGMEDRPGGALISFVLSGLLLIALISSTGGYYLNVYLNILLLTLVILLPAFRSDAYLGPLLFPLLMLNLVQLVLVYPVLHFEAFDYISYGEEKPWQQGQDLFSS